MAIAAPQPRVLADVFAQTWARSLVLVVGGAAFVGGDGGRGEPTFVDAAAVQAVGVGVIGVELDTEAGLEK